MYRLVEIILIKCKKENSCFSFFNFHWCLIKIYLFYSANLNSQGKETRIPERRQNQSRQAEQTRRRGMLNTPRASNLPGRVEK